MKKLLLISICLFVSGCATANVGKKYVLSARVKCQCAPLFSYSLVAKFSSKYKSVCDSAADLLTMYYDEGRGQYLYECLTQEQWQELKKDNQIIP